MDKKNDRLSIMYDQIKNVLEDNSYNIGIFRRISYGIQFRASKNHWSGIIRIYQNKKGNIKIDYSKLRDEKFEYEIRSIIIKNDIISEPKIYNKNKLNLDYPIIGTDESGKGDYFGPLVSAGVCVTQEIKDKLMGFGVIDSKKNSDKKNQELSRKIKQICKGRFAIIEISPVKYNQLYNNLRRENKNLNTLLAWGHAKTIEEILTYVECDIAIADQFADEKFILNKLQEKGKKIRLIQMHRAEQYTAVAAASILARSRYLEKLEELSNKYKIELPKGASNKVIIAGKQFISKYGKDSLNKVAKLHFKTTQKIISK
jgi:ribonuclease HIII